MGSLLTLPAVLITTLFTAFADKGFLYCLSYAVSYSYLCVSRRLSGRRLDLYDPLANKEPEKQGFIVPHQEWELDSPQEKSVLRKNADDVFCFGVNSSSDSLSVYIARKPGSQVQCSVFLRLSDGRTFTLPEEHLLQPETEEPNTFGSSRLKMECLQPMRKWRIFFNGTLKEVSNQGTDVTARHKHVKFSFYWTASTEVFDFTSDMSMKLMAESAASNNSWSWQFLQRLQSICSGYDHPGMFLGNVKVEDDTEKEIYLWGNRGHFMGKTADLKNGHFLQVYGNTQNGSLIRIAILELPEIIPTYVFGYVMKPNGYIFPIDGYTVEKKEKSIKMDISCHSGGQTYLMKVEADNTVAKFKREFSGDSVVRTANLFVNGMEAKGLVFEGKIQRQLKTPIIKNQIPICSQSSLKFIPLSIPFDDPRCQLAEVSGGKGSSLAKLSSIGGETNNRVGYSKLSFVVPKGIVVTTTAYQKFIRGTLENSLRRLEKAVWNKSAGDITEICRSITREVGEADLPESIGQSVEKDLNNIFGKTLDNLKFAVRSSATGEDTEQMSAAGQMDTYLGVVGITEILKAVKKCWASQFSFIAVGYKRRYGQPLNTPMAVVIQEMVPCDVAGVIFTCDPVTGNPAFISITANYGLGESVVSASAEPDTVTLERSINNKIKLHSQQVGSKKTKIVMTDSLGTEEIELSQDQTSQCCLSEELAIQLGYISVKIEEQFRTPRDIEWGILNDKIFMFQARPITSLDVETEFEIKHCFDTYMRREDEYTTKANVGEVLPGSSSPLGIDMMWKLAEVCYPRQKYIRWDGEALPNVPYYAKRIVTAFNHIFFCLSDAFFRFSEKKGEDTTDHTKALTVALFGRVIDDKKLFEMAVDRHGSSQNKKGTPIISQIYVVVLMFFAGYFNKKVAKDLKHFCIPVKNKDAAKIFDTIALHYYLIYTAMNSHMDCTLSSPFWNLSLLTLLAKEKGDWDNDVYGDFGYLLSTCTQVESAEVPAALQSLGYTIAKCIEPEKFKSFNEDAALKWLQSTPSEAGIKFQNFLKKHGHRCLKEFDMYAQTWKMNPKPLIKMLQGFVTADVKDTMEKKTIGFDTIVSKMHVKLGFLSRLRLRFLLPHCRRGVREREVSKSVLIKAMNTLREPFYLLAESMVEEGRLPNVELLFFLNIEEIYQLIKTRSPKLVARAFRRWKCHPELDKLIFPEIISGIPKPINMEEDLSMTEGDFSMTGVPVSQGIVKGIARVVVNIEDAPLIQSGDILITYATDIGWSPYFPLLSGVVTELGGLISHGAVVAREYGLPCVVNLHGATRAFKSGDLVLLDGNKGILKKLESANNIES